MNYLSNTLIATLLVFSANAADTAPVLSAQDFATKLSALQQNGNTYVRLQMEVKQANGTLKQKLDLQIKSRRTKGTTEVVYQVLWPKERKGETVLLRKPVSESATGSLLAPPDKPRPLNAAQLKLPVFDSDLCYEDLVDNAFAWEHQALTGTETVDGVSCQILESKPNKAAHSTYGSVRTWVDPRRMVPLRMEKYSPNGALIRRIDTTRVTTDDGHHIPANLLVRRPGQDTTTELEGTRIRRGVSYADRDFTTEAMTEMTAPRSAPD